MFKFSMLEKSDPELKHRVSVTVSDPQHTMASKRNEKMEKKVKLYAKDEKHAEELAKHHFKKQGYKVHDSNYISVVENVEYVKEATVDVGDVEKKKNITSKDKQTLGKVADLMARERQLRDKQMQKNKRVNELTSGALGRYIDKAGHEADKLKKHATSGEYKDIAKNLLAKRQKGLNRAANKLAHRAMMKDYHTSSKKGWSTEEVDMTEEKVTVKKDSYSWGKMVTIHKGASDSIPLHPEHQAKVKALRPSGTHSKDTFKDETGRRIHVAREGDKVHFLSSQGKEQARHIATVDYKHFDEQVDAPFTGGKPKTGDVKDKSGAVHTAMSRAKHLAKMAAAKEKKPTKGFSSFNKNK